MVTANQNLESIPELIDKEFRYRTINHMLYNPIENKFNNNVGGYEISTCFSSVTSLFYYLILLDGKLEKIHTNIISSIDIINPFIPLFEYNDNKNGNYYYKVSDNELFEDLKESHIIKELSSNESFCNEKFNPYPFLNRIDENNPDDINHVRKVLDDNLASIKLLQAEKYQFLENEPQQSCQLQINSGDSNYERAIYFLDFAFEVICKNFYIKDSFELDVEYLYLFMLLFYFKDVCSYSKKNKNFQLSNLITYFKNQLNSVFKKNAIPFEKQQNENIKYFHIFQNTNTQIKTYNTSQYSSIDMDIFKDILLKININNNVVREYATSMDKDNIDATYLNMEAMHVKHFLDSNIAYNDFIKNGL